VREEEHRTLRAGAAVARDQVELLRRRTEEADVGVGNPAAFNRAAIASAARVTLPAGVSVVLISTSSL
jgi:hypothetical protein